MRAIHCLTGLLLAGPAIAFGAEETTEEAQSPWIITAGGGVVLRPEFPGSDSNEVLPVPALNVRYRDRWFLNGDGLGAFLFQNERWSLATSIAPDFERRDESDADYLRGTGDIDRTALALIKGTYRFGMLTAAVSAGTDIANQDHGTVAELSLQAQSQITPRFSLAYGVAGRWIDEERAKTFFGITPQQSLASGLSPYVAESGMGDGRAFVNAIYGVNSRWILSGGLALGRLQGDAADSPLAEDEDFVVVNAALMYRF